MYSRSQTTIFQFLTQATELDPSVLQLVSVFGDIKKVHYRFPMQTAIMMFLWNTVYISNLGSGLLRIKSVGDCHVF